LFDHGASRGLKTVRFDPHFQASMVNLADNRIYRKHQTEKGDKGKFPRSNHDQPSADEQNTAREDVELVRRLELARWDEWICLSG
jgi:hypothetical protein